MNQNKEFQNLEGLRLQITIYILKSVYFIEFDGRFHYLTTPKKKKKQLDTFKLLVLQQTEDNEAIITATLS
jgi:hypothetical protein